MPGLNALIPLDATKLSESAFGLLPLLKKLGFAKVTLVSIWETSWDEKDVVERLGRLADVEAKGSAYLEAYLQTQAAKVREAGFEVDTVTRVGRAADETLAIAKEAAVDLIVIATHGRDGLARLRLGSVADKIIRGATCPTLVIGPNVEIDVEAYDLTRLVIPIDGSELSEAALPMGAWIARLEEAEIDLVRVVSVSSVAYDPSMSVYPADLITAIEDAAQAYLDQQAAALEARVAKVHVALRIGSAGEQVLEYLKERPAGLVVLASHGRSGVIRAALGSVADRMLHGPAPVLVLHPEEESTGGMVAAAEAAATG